MGLLGLFHLGILFVNVVRTTPTQGYDWPGHLTYLHHVARYWRAPSAAVTPQFFNPPLYYFCVAALHRLVGGALGQVGQIFNTLLAGATLFLLMLIGYKAWHGHLLPGAALVGLYVCNPTVYRAFGMVRPEAMLIPLFAGAGVLVLWSAEDSQVRWPVIAVCSGMISGIAVGVRQWGVFLEIAFLLWMAVTYAKASQASFLEGLGYLALQMVVFLGLAALFFSVRGGDVLTFNAPSQVPDPAFVTDLELKALFTHPVRPAINYRFWPVLYADFWGDYWRYWREALGRDPMPTSASVVTALVRAMWASLPASWLMFVGFW